MHNAKQVFRQATIADRARILEIYDHIFDAEEKGPRICGWRRGFYPNEAVCDEAISSGELVVLEVDDYVVGAGRYNQVQDEIFRKAKWEYDVPDEQVLVLHTLTVDPLCKGHGYGKAFLKYYEELALSMGCTVLRMDTGGMNTRARKIYADFQYKEVDRISFELPVPGKSQFTVIFLEKHL